MLVVSIEFKCKDKNVRVVSGENDLPVSINNRLAHKQAVQI